MAFMTEPTKTYLGEEHCEVPNLVGQLVEQHRLCSARVRVANNSEQSGTQSRIRRKGAIVVVPLHACAGEEGGGERGGVLLLCPAMARNRVPALC